jgi:hypothetical protein
MMNIKDFNQKWYLIGTIIGVFAGITIGWLMFS